MKKKIMEDFMKEYMKRKGKSYLQLSANRRKKVSFCSTLLEREIKNRKDWNKRYEEEK